MKKLVVVICLGVFLLGTGSLAIGAESGTAAEAEAMVKKAITMIKADGKEKALAEISTPKGKFVDRDLYITVYSLDGICLAHGANPKMVGKDLIELKDSDGKAFVKERMEIAKTKGKGWQDYKFTNPVSKKIEPKAMYFEKVGELVVACGIYKK
ncbi:MAG: histidine kinase [Desulfobacca sp.]|nr:histidine kinase [Desulfobacca sp.]